MIVRASLLSLLLLPYTLALDSPFNCIFPIGQDKYDLRALNVEKSISRTRETPPTSWVDEIRFNICSDLNKKDGVAEEDQCPAKTRACLTKTNKKQSAPDRVVAAIPLGSSSNVAPDVKALSSPLGLSLVFHGPAYPPIPTTEKQTLQSFNITLLCTPGETSEPKFLDYEGGIATVEWSAAAACVTSGDGKTGDGDKDKDHPEPDKDIGGGSSGVGWFFFLLFIAFGAYFALGAYHNYNQYGATGWDLIPHRDFWRDVPYLMQDLITHLCSSLRPNPSNRGGYHAV